MCSVLGQSKLAVTSYGDDHHHCSAVTVIALLIEGGVLHVHPAQVNPAPCVIETKTLRFEEFSSQFWDVGQPWVGNPRSTPRWIGSAQREMTTFCLV